MDGVAIKLLVDSGMCWHLSFYQSLGYDEEFDFNVLAHYQITLIVSLEEEVEGWGNTLHAAAIDALSKLEG